MGMKRLLFIPLLLLVFTTAAQKKGKQQQQEEEVQERDVKHLDLLMYYMDGEFEKCLKKSLNVTEDEEEGKDALPYLYVSMSYYQMSFLEQYKEEYPEALKEALKYAVKYRKKDDKNSLKKGLNEPEFWQENQEFFAKLRKTAKQEAEKMLDENKHSKAENYYKQITAFDPSDYSAWYMQAYLFLIKNDTLNAGKLLPNFQTELKKVADFASEPEDKVSLLKYGFMEYAKFFLNQGRSDLAKEVIRELRSYIGKDPQVEAFVVEKKLE